MTMRHPYEETSRRAIGESRSADALIRRVVRQFKSGTLGRGEAELQLRSAGAFEAEIKEALA